MSADQRDEGRARLRALLRDHRYTSRVTKQERGLMDHHIEALTGYMLDRKVEFVDALVLTQPPESVEPSLSKRGFVPAHHVEGHTAISFSTVRDEHHQTPAILTVGGVSVEPSEREVHFLHPVEGSTWSAWCSRCGRKGLDDPKWWDQFKCEPAPESVEPTSIGAALADVAERLLRGSSDIEPEIARILYSNLWDLYDGAAPESVGSHSRGPDFVLDCDRERIFTPGQGGYQQWLHQSTPEAAIFIPVWRAEPVPDVEQGCSNDHHFFFEDTPESCPGCGDATPLPPLPYARFCNQVGGCGKSWAVHDERGSHVCQNPSHHTADVEQGEPAQDVEGERPSRVYIVQVRDLGPGTPSEWKTVHTTFDSGDYPDWMSPEQLNAEPGSEFRWLEYALTTPPERLEERNG